MRAIKLIIANWIKQFHQKRCNHEYTDVWFGHSAEFSHSDICRQCGKVVWRGGRNAWRKRHGFDK